MSVKLVKLSAGDRVLILIGMWYAFKAIELISKTCENIAANCKEEK
jgi:hypothetical protein